MTTIFVTHEQIEALTLSDVIAVMKDGKIVQEGTPLDIYRQPATAFVADFIGKSNLVSATVAAPANGSAVLRVDSPLGSLACTAQVETDQGAAMIIAIRPEHIELVPSGTAEENMLHGVLETASFIGNTLDCTVRIGDTSLKVQLHPDHAPGVGSTVALYVAARHCLAMRAND
jgi:ABC-type Fe3+/spermidine/putrescine transport system ATPase subunit